MCSGKHGRIYALPQGVHSPPEDPISMATHVDRDSNMAIRRNQFLADLMDVAKKHLQEHVPGPAADLVAGSLTDHLADYWGGQLINIPKDYRWKLSQREAEIYAEFNGYNIAELARKYDMHERSMRKLLDRVKKRMAVAADRRNRDLFND